MTAMVGKRLCQIKVPRLDAYDEEILKRLLALNLARSGAA
jgi:hypothetical protein